MANVEPLDVYAQAFVPDMYKAVNRAPSHVVTCKAAPWTDYRAYVQSFAGSSFLPPKRRLKDSITGSTSDRAGQPQDMLSANNGAHSTEYSSHIDVTETKLNRATQITTSSPAEPARTLSPSNYASFFATALQNERDALCREYEQHALYKVTLQQTNYDTEYSMYRLLVPGLRELSIPIEGGDIVQVRQLTFDHYKQPIPFSGFTPPRGTPIPSPLDVRHDAVIWTVDRTKGILFLRVDGLRPMSMLFNASFTLQTGRFDAISDACQEASQMLHLNNTWLRSMLFPEYSDGVMQTKLNRFDFGLDQFDSDLNYEQLKAIYAVSQENYGAVPYLVHGPPGTGKTKTVIELAMQLISQDRSAKLLLCAPSDSAADTLISRLKQHLLPGELLRLNSPARSFPEVPDAVLPYCYSEERFFTLPPFADVMRKRIVVCTVRDAHILHQARITNKYLYFLEHGLLSALHADNPPSVKLHWSALIMDEAAQATEPEALLPLLAVAPPENVPPGMSLPQVVMVGDKNQLGPRTASRSTDIQTSLFERLLARPLYLEHPLARSKEKGGHIPRLTSDMLPITRPPFTDLIRNYRSHAAIIAIPSTLFYSDTLEPTAANTDSLLHWYGFKGRRMPVLFRNNVGLDDMELDGGGWFNLQEADIALDYASSFLRQDLLNQEEICIISPFRAQVKVLRQKARSKNMFSINIGPLEAFQGLESRLVILCTTRTRSRYIDQDVAKGLGVIHEPRRFNVALTRAREGLIVIGNPDVLEKDPNWISFMAFCKRNGAREGDVAWQEPQGQEIKMSRLEVQQRVQARADGDGLESDMRKFGLTSNEEDETWEAGLEAEEFVKHNATL